MKKGNLDWKSGIIALTTLAIIVVLTTTGYNLLFNKGNPKATDKVDLTHIKGYGTTPQESVTKFITSAGTIGDPNKVTVEALRGNTAIKLNAQHRIDSYNEAIPGIYSSSPISISNNELFIKRYGVTSQSPEFFSVADIRVSKPTREYTLTNEKLPNGTAKAVDIYATFTSTYTFFKQKSFDSTWDGTYQRITNVKRYDNLKFTLIKESSKDWRIYSYDDSKNKIGSRFATWNTQGDKYIDHKDDVVQSELKAKEGK